MLKNCYLILFFLTQIIIPSVHGQHKVFHEQILWQNVQHFSAESTPEDFLYFEEAVTAEPFGTLPVYSKLLPFKNHGTSYDFHISDTRFVPFEDQLQIAQLQDIDKVSEKLQYFSEIITSQKKDYCHFQLLPLRRNPTTGQFEKLTSFTVTIQLQKDVKTSHSSSAVTFNDNSVLSEGDWYRMTITKNGVYKLTYEELTGAGMNLTGINSGQLRIYGNGGEMLPERNGDFRYDDLQENAIHVEDGGDGTFDPGDFLIFYGQGTSIWKFVPLRTGYEFVRHHYSDENYYYITLKDGEGKRIQPQQEIPGPATQIITTFNDYATFSLDSINLIRSGSEWFSHEFSEITSRTYHFDFPRRDVTQSVLMVTNCAARSYVNSNFNINANGNFFVNLPIGAVPQGNQSKFGNELTKIRRDVISGSKDITIELIYDKPHSESVGWLDYIDLNVMSMLEFTGGQMEFRNIFARLYDTISTFKLAQVNIPVTIWDITDLLNIQSITYTISDEDCFFIAETKEIREYLAFDNTVFHQIEKIEKIENQNLHALEPVDFLIITHPDFLDQAQRLKALHEELDGFSVHVIEPEKIYNEFSSGKQDPAAIRDFVRMIFERSGDPPKLKYLLLFGDGSFDPKNRLENNRFFIPTFQSKQSLSFTTSYVSDDFYGLMDINEGEDGAGNLDIGIGRLPVNTAEEAKALVDKFERYMKMTPDNTGNWKNTICFIADDEDENLHIYQADTILVNIVSANNNININKIYFDAFNQVSTSVGDRFPDATEAINHQMNEGALIMNYTGHGGEVALAHERVIQVQDILSWNNKYKMPVMITATCEFAPYDNPGMISAGEQVILNPNGGAVGLMSTTRVAFATSNIAINRRIYDTLFRSNPDNYPRLGDLVKFSKIPSNVNTRNFTLLGNPALKLAFPENDIIIDSINGHPANNSPDTIHAGSFVSFSGFIADYASRQIIDSFNGFIYPALYDKPTPVTTLGNDPKSFPYQFDLQQEIIYQGKYSVKNGRFSFSFIVPVDIAYNYGQGKLSLYANDSTTDASGSCNNFIIGGFDVNQNDFTGPEIMLYLNDKTFLNGSMVNNNPVMYAEITDPSGINIFGSGIGHDIVARLTGPVNTTVILNENFAFDLDKYQSGRLTYLFETLPNGSYSLELKAWDMLNNSSANTINFVVSDNISINLQQVYNYPNPFTDFTYFTFRHNQFNSSVTVEINIYNINGELVKTIGPIDTDGSGYFINPIKWDGTGEGGTKLKPGLYVYTLDVNTQQNDFTRMVQKLIIGL
ncbi:MAG TPA: type IX secretion system sortase PorU [Bacteroidales bacterium]|nr:type IX secretion system sortase PorU [Bacteroidales bacterium]